jgi:hypothetical protein
MTRTGMKALQNNCRFCDRREESGWDIINTGVMPYFGIVSRGPAEGVVLGAVV